MKKTRKILLMAACAVLLVCISVGATVAYLTSTDEVTNTFTVGNIKITLDEAKVDGDGKALTGDAAERVKNNDYHLFPGHVYDKDPIVRVDANAENCYLFVKVVNGIEDLESKAIGYKSIATQMAENGWVALKGVDDVYYKADAAGNPVLVNKGQDYYVFNGFAIDENAETNKTVVDAETNKETLVYQNATITINAYAVQADGFATAKAAWDATFGKPVLPEDTTNP